MFTGILGSGLLLATLVVVWWITTAILLHWGISLLMLVIELVRRRMVAWDIHWFGLSSSLAQI